MISRDGEIRTSMNKVLTLRSINFDLIQKHPKNFWLAKENQKAFLQWLGPKLQFSSMEDWYQVKREHFYKNHGSGLLNHYNQSPAQVVTGILEGHTWQLWKFQNAPSRIWDDPRIVLDFIKALQIHLKFSANNNDNDNDNINKMINPSPSEDWYKIRGKDFVEFGGGSLLQKYNYSPSEILCSVFPEHTWLPWKFDNSPQNIWHNEQIRLKYMKWLAEKLGLKTMEDWYKVKQSDFYNHHGKTLLSFYSYSPRITIMSILQAHVWESWKFGGKFQSLGDDDVIGGDPKVTQKIRNFVEEVLKPICKVQNLEDWYRVTSEDIERVGRRALVQRSGGLVGLLRRAYPTHKWDWNRFTKITRKKTQLLMMSAIRELFPDNELFEDYLHPSIVYENKESIQLDAFIPSLSLAFEYQGPHHFQRDIFFTHLAQGDLAKKLLCEKHQISLIAVPHWWDKTTDSLGFLIHKIRPDLLQKYMENKQP